MGQGFSPPADAVLLISQANAPFIDTTNYTSTPYRHRWWFIEESYRDLTLGKVWNRYTNPLAGAGPITIPKPDIGNLEQLADFWLFRRAQSFTGAVNAVAFFPESLAGFDTGSEPPKPAPAPQPQDDGRILIGRAGNGPGELTSPADAFVDSQGNIWVADSRNNRIQKFDSGGTHIASFGGGGTGPGRFNEPWSVAVDGEGFIYVVDTWNHRIQKFRPDFTFVKSWGEPYYGANPGPFQVFGPRDIALAPDGTLWVTDTGNKRIANYSREGEFLRQIGRPGSALGELDEAVSIAFDATGRLVVTDNWNERIQRFSPDLTSSTAHAAGWISREATHKPYLAVLIDGRVVASDPQKGTLMLFDFSGPIRTWKPADGGRPIGVAALPDGGFVFTDAARNEAQIVPASALPRLFR